MYENGEVRPVEIIQGMREGEEGIMMEGVNSSKIYCKNFCKCPNVTPSTTIKHKYKKYAK
jgi:hypothetical protein